MSTTSMKETVREVEVISWHKVLVLCGTMIMIAAASVGGLAWHMSVVTESTQARIDRADARMDRWIERSDRRMAEFRREMAEHRKEMARLSERQANVEGVVFTRPRG